ncbi:MAG: diguanylate cyclase [Oscillospiraceae bacterium]|nr:diguanylate cyclase [Oscillospiraceae bacterium]
MRSIQTKIFFLILTCIVVSSAIIGGIGIFISEITVDSDSAKIMNLLCSEKAQELNSTLGRIEQSVDIVTQYAADNLESTEKLASDRDYLRSYLDELRALGMTAAEKTEGAVTYYVRFDPEITGDNQGFFMVRNPQSSAFEANELTDLLLYSPDDVEHVGWYYIPLQAEKAVWLQPYYNKNIDVYMISYVSPIYKDGIAVGVAGMDIDFSYLTQFTDSILLYETGYGYLTDSDLNVVHSKISRPSSYKTSLTAYSAEEVPVLDSERVYDYEIDGNKMQTALRPLDNGMYLAVAAPASEIDRSKNILISNILLCSCIISLIFIIISSGIVKKMIRPLKELDAAAKKFAEGDFDVSITADTKDEIGTLAESFSETADRLKAQMDYINSLAYTDSLTGINNNTAYLRDTAALRTDIEKGTADFAVAVIDVNGLKHINDTLGHEKGNELINAAANTASEVFGRENTYRIGGDEFAVLMKNTNAEEFRRLSEKYTVTLEAHKCSVPVSAAIGTAVYDQSSDGSFEAVFRRADEEMYKIKAEMKSYNENAKQSLKE